MNGLRFSFGILRYRLARSFSNEYSDLIIAEDEQNCQNFWGDNEKEYPLVVPNGVHGGPSTIFKL